MKFFKMNHWRPHVSATLGISTLIVYVKVAAGKHVLDLAVFSEVATTGPNLCLLELLLKAPPVFTLRRPGA